MGTASFGGPSHHSRGSAGRPATDRVGGPHNGATVLQFVRHGPALDRVALVSGGNRGLGLEVVGALAGLGMRVVLGSRSVEQGRAALARLGPLAGRVALLGAWQLSQAVARLMRHRRFGRIVNVSSGLASLKTMRRGLPAYRVSKCAVNALTRVLADELSDDGILVNTCRPGLAWGDPQGGRQMVLASGIGRHPGVAGDAARQRADGRLLARPRPHRLVRAVGRPSPVRATTGARSRRGSFGSMGVGRVASRSLGGSPT